MLTAKMISDFVEKNRDEAIRCFQEIIQTPSETGNEEAVSFVFERWMKDNGMEVKRYDAAPHRPNLISTWTGSQPGKRFVFNGHMDVFPPDPDDSGLYGPWSGKIVDGKLYGRGAADMKGGDCGALMAVIFLRRMGFDPKGSVTLNWVSDEENGGEFGIQYLLKQGLIDGDVGLCMEPTDADIIYRHAGILRGYITYTAKAHHTSVQYPYGEHALQKALRAVVELQKINDRLKPNPTKVYPDPVFTISVFNSGKAPNVYPSEATFWFDRRLAPGENHDEALAEITGILDSLREKDPAYDYKITVTSRRPFLDIPVDDPFLSIVAKSYKEITGKDVKMRPAEGGSDAAWLQKVTGMVIPNFGGALRLADSGKPNEKFDIQTYLDFIKIYMMTVVNTLG